MSTRRLRLGLFTVVLLLFVIGLVGSIVTGQWGLILVAAVLTAHLEV